MRKAVAVEPRNSDLHYNLGLSYWRGAQLDRAMASFDRAIELNPDNVKARWARVMLWAPAFSSNGAGDSPDRSGFGGELAEFEDWWVKSETDGAIFVGELQPFFLTYQEESNLALLKRYGRVCAMAMQRWLDRQKSPAVQETDGKADPAGYRLCRYSAALGLDGSDQGLVPVVRSANGLNSSSSR